MLTDEQLHELAAEWLGTQFPGNFTGRDEWVVRTLTDKEYPTGWDGFAEDMNSAHAVS